MQGGRGPLCQGVKKKPSPLSGNGGEKEKREEEGLNFSKKTTSTCYPMGQFSTYRLDKTSSPPPTIPHPQPQFPMRGDK